MIRNGVVPVKGVGALASGAPSSLWRSWPACLDGRVITYYLFTLEQRCFFSLFPPNPCCFHPSLPAVYMSTSRTLHEDRDWTRCCMVEHATLPKPLARATVENDLSPSGRTPSSFPCRLVVFACLFSQGTFVTPRFAIES